AFSARLSTIQAQATQRPCLIAHLSRQAWVGPARARGTGSKATGRRSHNRWTISWLVARTSTSTRLSSKAGKSEGNCSCRNRARSSFSGSASPASAGVAGRSRTTQRYRSGPLQRGPFCFWRYPSRSLERPSQVREGVMGKQIDLVAVLCELRQKYD